MCVFACKLYLQNTTEEKDRIGRIYAKRWFGILLKEKKELFFVMISGHIIHFTLNQNFNPLTKPQTILAL